MRYKNLFIFLFFFTSVEPNLDRLEKAIEEKVIGFYTIHSDSLNDSTSLKYFRYVPGHIDYNCVTFTISGETDLNQLKKEIIKRMGSSIDTMYLEGNVLKVVQRISKEVGSHWVIKKENFSQKIEINKSIVRFGPYFELDNVSDIWFRPYKINDSSYYAYFFCDVDFLKSCKEAYSTYKSTIDSAVNFRQKIISLSEGVYILGPVLEEKVQLTPIREGLYYVSLELPLVFAYHDAYEVLIGATKGIKLKNLPWLNLSVNIAL